VHTLKNIYNNFQARKFFDCPSMPGDLPDGCKADFGHIAELHHHEETMSLKKAHMLRPAVLQPKSIEKTSVKLAVAVFCESTRDALRYYAANEGKVHWTGTADFINLVTKLWNVLNVKTCCKGMFKRNETMDPVRDNLDWQLGFLIDFAVFVAKWETSKKTQDADRVRLHTNYPLLDSFRRDPLAARVDEQTFQCRLPHFVVLQDNGSRYLPSISR
jgi:hypothetical protein